MEIKTTSEIGRRLRELILDAKDLERIDKRENYCKKEWVVVVDVINYLENNSFGYRDLGCNVINGDELREELQHITKTNSKVSKVKNEQTNE